MKIAHLNSATPVKGLKNAIIDIYTKEKLNLKYVHEFVTGKPESKRRLFPNFIA